MDLDQKLHAFQQKYTNLEQQAEQGSNARHTYGQIVVWMNSAQNETPAMNRAYHMRILLVSLAKVLDPPDQRHIVWGAVKELEQTAALPPMC